jgi:death on curing protein
VKAWRWVRLDVAYAVHDHQIAEHGGLVGLRDSGALESALARPQNLAGYEKPDAAALAASYAFALARNHPFVDGNKRTGWVLARLFLADNGLRLRFEPADAVRLMEGLASDTLTESEAATWFRSRISAG